MLLAGQLLFAYADEPEVGKPEIEVGERHGIHHHGKCLKFKNFLLINPLILID